MDEPYSIILTERTQTSRHMGVIRYMNVQNRQIETERSLVVPRDAGEEDMDPASWGGKLTSWCDKNVLQFIVVMVAQL